MSVKNKKYLSKSDYYIQDLDKKIESFKKGVKENNFTPTLSLFYSYLNTNYELKFIMSNDIFKYMVQYKVLYKKQVFAIKQLKDGIKIYLLSFLPPDRNSKGLLQTAFIKDFNEKYKLNAELIKAQKEINKDNIEATQKYVVLQENTSEVEND